MKQQPDRFFPILSMPTTATKYSERLEAWIEKTTKRLSIIIKTYIYQATTRAEQQQQKFDPSRREINPLDEKAYYSIVLLSFPSYSQTSACLSQRVGSTQER